VTDHHDARTTAAHDVEADADVIPTPAAAGPVRSHAPTPRVDSDLISAARASPGPAFGSIGRVRRAAAPAAVIRRSVVVRGDPEVHDAGIWDLLGRKRPADHAIAQDPETALIEHLVTATTAPYRFSSRADLEAFIARYKMYFGPGKDGAPKPGLSLSNAAERYRAEIVKVTVGGLKEGYSNLTQVITINPDDPASAVGIRCYLSHKRHSINTMMIDLATPIASKEKNVIVTDRNALNASVTAFVQRAAEALRGRAMLLGFDPSALGHVGTPAVEASTDRQPQPPEAAGPWLSEIHLQPRAGPGAVEFDQEEFAQFSRFVQALMGADHQRHLRSNQPRPLFREDQRAKAAKEITQLATIRCRLAAPPIGLADGDNAATAATAFGLRMIPAIQQAEVIAMSKHVAAALKLLKSRGVAPEIDPATAPLFPTRSEALAIWGSWNSAAQDRARNVLAAAGRQAQLNTFLDTVANPVGAAAPDLNTQIETARAALRDLQELQLGTILKSGWQPADTDKVRRVLEMIDAQFPGCPRSQSKADRASNAWR
jgi:hypothetical protein